MKTNFIFLAIIPVLILLVPNVYAGGARGDYDERYEDVPGAPECWLDGFDAGFAGKYDKDRAKECNHIPGDQYNASWIYGCEGAGYIEEECNDIKKDSNGDISHESLREENRRDCYDDGYEDGQNNPFDHDRNNACYNYGRTYFNGFLAGCESAGNTNGTCEGFTDV